MTKVQIGFSRLQLVAMSFLALVALSISGYLAWHGFHMTPVAGCGGGVFDCDHVLTSKWGKLLGIPVAAFAVLIYTSLLAAFASYAMLGSTMRGLVHGMITFLCCMAGLAACWFISLQAFVIGHFCIYCLAAHSCGLVLAGLAVSSQLDRPNFSSRIFSRPVSAAALSVLVFVLAQVASEPAPTYEVQEYDLTESEDPAETVAPEVISPFDFDEPEPTADESDVVLQENEVDVEAEAPSKQHAPTQEPGDVAPTQSTSMIGIGTTLFGLITNPTFSLVGVLAKEDEAKVAPRKISFGRIATLQTDQWPLIGPVDAPRITAEMFDYTCPSCRATAPALEKTYKEYDGQLAIIALPVPMNPLCNDTVTATPPGHEQACDLAKTAIAVWLANPEKFAEFHHWMMQGDAAPSLGAAQVQARKLVGDADFEKVLASGKPAKYLKANLRIYKLAGKGKIPKLLLKKTSLVGKTTSSKIIKDLIDRD